MKQHPTLILLYHHCAPEKEIKFRPDRKIYVGTEQFQKQLEWMRQNMAIITMDQMVSHLEAGTTPHQPSVVLTFDDGHRDNYEHAWPIARRFESPILIYLCTRWIENEPWLWRLDIVDMILLGQPIRFEWCSKTYRIQCHDNVAQSSSYRMLAEMFVKLNKPEQFKLLEVILNSNGQKVKMRPSEFLSWDEIRTMLDSGEIEIGAHTQNHPMLSMLTEPQAIKELTLSRNLIEEKVKSSVLHFAYPYGGENAAGEREHRICREVGYRSSVMSMRGVCGSKPWYSSPFGMPRLSVNGLWSQDQFVAETTQCISGD